MQEQSDNQYPSRKRENLSDVSGDAAELFQQDNPFPDDDVEDVGSQSEESIKHKRLGKKIKKEPKPDIQKKRREKQRERQRDRQRDRDDIRGKDRDKIKSKKKDRERERDRDRDRQRERQRTKEKRDLDSDSESDTQKKKNKKHKRGGQQNRKSAKTQQQERLDAICKTKAQSILQRMNTAADLDIKSNKKGQASCEKLIYVKQLVKHLQTTSVAHFFIQGDGLHLFERWLRKYPDGTEPSYNLKKQCFLILLRLPITGDSLSRCQGLLTIVQKHQSCKERELKDLADSLTFRWANIMNNPYDDSD